MTHSPFVPPDGFVVVWEEARPVTRVDARWVGASYDTCAGVTLAWRCPDTNRPDGWGPVDLVPVRWIPDPHTDRTTHRQKCLLLVTRGGQPVAIAVHEE